MTEPAFASPSGLADTVRTWVRAWTVSRELDPPRPHGSGWRVEATEGRLTVSRDPAASGGAI